MITKGIIEEIISPYKAKVRLPIFDGIEGSQTALSTKDLSAATICTLPNLTSVVSVGDIVYVGFEDDDIARPIILGHLSKESGTDTKAILTLDGLNVEGITKLSEQTNIGKVKPNEIARLTGVKANVQDQLNNLSQYTPLLNELDINTRNLLVLEDFNLTSAGITIQTSFVDQSFSISGRNEAMFEFTADVPIKPIQLTKDIEYLFSLQNLSNAISNVSFDLRNDNSSVYIIPDKPYTPTNDVIIDTLHVTVFGTRQIYSTLYMMLEQGSTLHSWVKPMGLVYSTDTRLQNIAHTTDPEIVFAENERLKTINLFDVNNIHRSRGSLCFDISKLEMGKTYTFSCVNPIGWFKISNSASGYNSVSTESVNNDIYKFTFTMTRNSNISETATQYLFLGKGDLTLYSYDEIINKQIQIQEGSVATSIQPFEDNITHNGSNVMKFSTKIYNNTKNLCQTTLENFTVASNKTYNMILYSKTRDVTYPLCFTSNMTGWTYPLVPSSAFYRFTYTDGSVSYLTGQYLENKNYQVIFDGSRDLQTITMLNWCQISGTFRYVQLEENYHFTEYNSYEGSFEYKELIYDSNEKPIPNGSETSYTSGINLTSSGLWYSINMKKFKRLRIVASYQNKQQINIFVDLSNICGDTSYSARATFGNDGIYLGEVGIGVNLNKDGLYAFSTVDTTIYKIEGWH